MRAKVSVPEGNNVRAGSWILRTAMHELDEARVSLRSADLWVWEFAFGSVSRLCTHPGKIRSLAFRLLIYGKKSCSPPTGRFLPRFIISPGPLRLSDIGVLRTLHPAVKQDHHRIPIPPEEHAVAGAHMDAELAHAIAYSLPVAEGTASVGEPTTSWQDPSARRSCHRRSETCRTTSWCRFHP